MIDLAKLEFFLGDYKKDFLSRRWEEERYKWVAVAHFQNNWDINASDFGEMFTRATSKTRKDKRIDLLDYKMNLPRKMIQNFAAVDMDATRAMFINLFDESKEFVERVKKFCSYAEVLRKKYNDGTWTKSYQHLNSISTYLWLRYPDTYYIYKFTECKAIAQALGSDFIPKKDGLPDNLVGVFKLYDEIREYLAMDEKLKQMLQSVPREDCYPDTSLRTLTIDVGFYISHIYKPKFPNAEPYSAQRQGPSEDEQNSIMNIVREENPVAIKESNETYSKKNFLAEVYMTGERFDTLVSLLKNKQNLILQGAPGVGKTFAAKRLAYAMMEEKDDSRVEFIQFHQNYSYEDFVMGYKPSGEGFELQNGIFYRFCQKAANMPDKPFFFIIDEINRGNLSKIFGELLMLIEKDYRGIKATLAYQGMPFAVPKNLYIIGMMNTADRSLAMMDYALRRRFSFFEMEPGFDSGGFKAYQAGFAHDTFNVLVERVKGLNREIAADSSLGKGFCIGHSYFCGRQECTDAWLAEVVKYDILPMLGEYWFDDPEKLNRWEGILRGIFHDEQ